MIIILILLVVLVDLWTKYAMQTLTKLHNLVIIEDFFHLTYVKNTGMACSLLSGNTKLLAIVSVVAIIIILYIVYKYELHWFYKFAFGLILGGAFGNLYDRVMLGYVRDFLDFYIFGYNFPVFNFADAALTVGVIILAICILLDDRNGKKLASRNRK